MKRVSLQAKIIFYYNNNHQVCGNACHVHPFSNVDLHFKVIILLEKIWVCGLNIRRERSIQESQVKSDEVGERTDMKRLLLVRRTGGWEPGIIGGRKGFSMCSKEKLKGAQHNALT